MQENFNSSINLNQENSIVMKNRKSIHPFLALAGSVLLVSALTPATFAGVADPVSIVNVTVDPLSTDFYGTPFARPVETRGTISSVSTNSTSTIFTVSVDAGETALDNAGFNFSNTSTAVDAWYVLEVLDGPAIGLIMDITAATASTVTCQNRMPDPTLVSAGSKFNIRKAWTLATLFGASTNNINTGTAAIAAAYLGSGTTPTSTGVKARVQTFDPFNNSLTTYYIRSSGGNFEFRATTSTNNADHTPLGMGRGFLIVNTKNSNQVIPFSGEYRIARSRFVVPGSRTALLANPGPFTNDFVTADIVNTSPARDSGATTSTNPRATASDTWSLWNRAGRAFDSYRVGTGPVGSNTPSMYVAGLSTATNPVIRPFGAVAVKPIGNTTTTKLVTISPALK